MRPRELLRAMVGPVALGAALGALGGWLWWTWWGPAPDGKVYDTTAGPTWYPNPFDPGITRDFSGTATYVVVAFGLALLLGVVGGWLARDRAVPGLVAVALGSLVAGLLMTVIGIGQSPPDPRDKVDEVKIGTELPGHLEVSGWTPYLAWPVGGLLGHLVLMLALGSGSATGESRRPGQPSAEPALQD
ncbi:MAG TPA: hypothetical protein VNS46_09325 [Nocardioides sp.]|nr:hypothetical protein [Nocardioides sp.]